MTTPFSILIDTREQHPYTFQGILADAKHGRVPLIVHTEIATLKTGDYSIDSMEHLVCVERKSLADAYGTFGGGRERFERELERMLEFDHAAVVIESSMRYALENPPLGSGLSPKSMWRSVNAWEQRYGVHFHWCDDRFLAERKTWNILKRYWHDVKEGKRHGKKV